jgi:hypothetical protein
MILWRWPARSALALAFALSLSHTLPAAPPMTEENPSFLPEPAATTPTGETSPSISDLIGHGPAPTTNSSATVPSPIDSPATSAAPVNPAASPAPESEWPNWVDSYQQSEAWDDRYERERQYYFSTELMLSWGLAPGDSLIGSEEFGNLYFFPTAPNSFPHQRTGDFTDQFHYGVRGRFGWDNPDDSGVMVSGFAVFERRQQRGPGRIFYGEDIYQLQPLASFPLNEGGGNGTVVPFDSAFAQRYDQSLWGGDIDAYLAPFFERPSFQMKLLFGAKYVQLSEQFNVMAGDSGLGYTVNTTNNTIDYSTVQDIGIPPYEMQIYSSTTSNLVGPQVGLRYDLGNEQIKVWGQTKFALAANFEKTRIGGENVVNGFQAAAQQGPPFYQTDSTTHVSPVFETSIYCDMYLFAMLPLVRHVEFLRQAQFRIGFDYLLLGEVARPTNIIAYNSPTPALKANRTWFDMKTLTLGMTWRF